jgi:8-oxo-dGTP pyrophosphatase MutT (NUDIX family)
MPHSMTDSRDDAEMLTQEQVSRALRQRPPRLLASEARAAVALLIDCTSQQPQMLFIQRAVHPADPWSGHIAFPGGKYDVADGHLQVTARRETREEIGIDLSSAKCLGQLDDVHTSVTTIAVSAFAYAVQPPYCPQLSAEVEDCFWYSLAQLEEPGRRTRLTLGERDFPALSLGPQRPLLWGVTFRFVEQLLARLAELSIYPEAS